MVHQCHLRGRSEAALKLLEDIDRRGTIAAGEKLPAWRAITLFLRFGVERNTCQSIVEGIKSVDVLSSR
jgi:hypothetical protein